MWCFYSYWVYPDVDPSTFLDNLWEIITSINIERTWCSWQLCYWSNINWSLWKHFINFRTPFCMLLTSQARNQMKHLSCRYQCIMNGPIWSKCLQHHTTKLLAWWSPSAFLAAQLPFIGDRKDTLLAYLASAQALSVIYSSLLMNNLPLDVWLKLWAWNLSFKLDTDAWP